MHVCVCVNFRGEAYYIRALGSMGNLLLLRGDIGTQTRCAERLSFCARVESDARRLYLPWRAGDGSSRGWFERDFEI